LEKEAAAVSDELHKTLPNGWEITVSNGVYTDFQGINYEVTGVEPDVLLEPFSLEVME